MFVVVVDDDGKFLLGSPGCTYACGNHTFSAPLNADVTGLGQHILLNA